MIGWRYGILSRYLLAELLLLCILYSVLCVPSVPSYSEYNISNILLYASTHTDSSDILYLKYIMLLLVLILVIKNKNHTYIVHGLIDSNSKLIKINYNLLQAWVTHDHCGTLQPNISGNVLISVYLLYHSS
jgi:hypothetical protein